uniref:Uncharacterized protein n=1 Tax=Helianthus annuus TaxID=4232 RepID=A0A251V489_HELAN
MATVVVTMDLDVVTFLQASGGDFVTRKVKRQRDIRRNRKREEDEDQELREGPIGDGDDRETAVFRRRR